MSNGNRAGSMQKVMDALSKRMCGHTQEEAMKLGVCTTCGGDVDLDNFVDEFSKREYKISGMCQKCQDEVFTNA